MTEAEKKKARNKARKAELKAQKENKPPKKGKYRGRSRCPFNETMLT
jgi:hypothetical protein